MKASERPTLADVAAAAGVSRALVSIVIRNAPGASVATRARVLTVADELGYRPDRRARSLRSHESRLLGLTFRVDDAFHGDLIAALYCVAEAAGYEVVLSGVTADRDEQRAVDTLIDERCAALILLGPTGPPGRLAELAASRPVVSVARRLGVDGVDTVRTADARGVRSGVEHLIAGGHRVITHIDGGRAPGAADRRRGYRQAMTANGLVEHIRIVAGGPGEDDGARAAAEVLGTAEDQRRPSAVVAFNDACAIGVLDTLVRAGLRVPRDMSVIGFDDSRLARLRAVDLTTVAQPVAELAQAAVRCVLDRLGDVESKHSVDLQLKPALVVRTTTGPPRTSQRSKTVTSIA